MKVKEIKIKLILSLSTFLVLLFVLYFQVPQRSNILRTPFDDCQPKDIKVLPVALVVIVN